MKKTSSPTLLEALDISKTTVWVDPDLFKTVAILVDTTVRRSAVEEEGLKP